MQIRLLLPRFFFYIGLCISLGLVCGCIPRPLLNQTQLKGADPAFDLAATSQVRHMRSLPSTRVSVRGVRLLDPLARAFKVWGKAQKVKGRVYIWMNSKGVYTRRILLGRQKTKNSRKTRFVVRQIDVFSSYENQLHPHNTVFFASKKIRSSAWRGRIFGTYGKQKQESLKERFTFSKRGYSFLLFSPLLPLHKKIRAVFSLSVPKQKMNALQIVPIY